MPTALIGAGISAAGSIAGGSSGKKGANKAAQLQAQSYANALAEQKAEFAQTQQNISPYLQAGTGALGGEQTLLGLNGNAQQQSAFDALKASPAFTSLYGTGLDAINQNAAATGGLRGGNTALAQSNFGSSLLAQVIQNQIGNLGGLVSTGANAAAGLASAGQNSANAISGLTTQAGNSAAGNALGQSLIGNNTVNGLQASLQKLLAGSGGSNLSGVSAGAVPASGGINNLANYGASSTSFGSLF